MQTTSNNSVSPNQTSAILLDRSGSHGAAMKDSSDAILQLESISCERGERLLVEDLSLALRPKQGIRIEGPNGSGKTTLLRVIAGLSQQYTGRMSWNGLDLREDRSVMASDTLYIGHLAGVKALLTPFENLSWWSALHLLPSDAIDHKQQLLAALAKVGLHGFADTPCYRLSAGQQRRVALARLYLSQHCLWILDEPFTAIDVDGVRSLEQCIAAHLSDGGMALVTTHQSMEIEGISRCSLNDFLPHKNHQSAQGSV